MKNIKIKTLTIVTLIIFIIINSILLFTYYNFYVSGKITSDLIETKNKNHEILYLLSENIKGYDLENSILIMKVFVKKNGGYVSLKSSEGIVIYTNKKDISKLYSSSGLVLIDNIPYELTYSKMDITPGIKFIRNLMVYEIILLTSLIVVVYIFSSYQFINPVNDITNDMNNYKYGKIPKKRKMPKTMQQIQNTFVDVVNNLEMEKEHQNHMIAAISHDIKTPLTSVIGYADRIKNNKLDDEKRQKYIEKIYSKSILIKEILEDFDDYQSHNIKSDMKLEKIKLSDIKNEIIKDFKDDLKDKKIKLNIIDDTKDVKLLIDTTKIRRVFGNIITNSVTHFNNKQGIINIYFNVINNKLLIEIADNAGGILDEKVLKKIFEPLYTTDPSRKISGLGLSISKQIIKSHDGIIYADNNKIGGLSIYIELPVTI